MVCTSAEEVQARLAIRALWSSNDEDDRQGSIGFGQSLLHKQVRAEVEEVLRNGLRRRLERLEKNVALLCQGNGSATSAEASGQPVAAGAQTGHASTDLLSKAVAQALKNRKHRPKEFAPTEFQKTLQVPKPDHNEEMLPEGIVLKQSLDAIDENLVKRQRQIGNLSSQLNTVEKMYKEDDQDAKHLRRSLSAVTADPKLLAKTFEQRLERRRDRIEEIREKLERSQNQATRYRDIARQQHGFFLQRERMLMHGGPQAVARHPAGDLCIVPKPPSLADEKPEVWNVGTAIANPYVVDSWPFEPNVLYQQTNKEGTMQPFVEESEEDLIEDSRRFPNPFRINIPGRGEDEDDDRYQGPSETSRSL